MHIICLINYANTFSLLAYWAILVWLMSGDVIFHIKWQKKRQMETRTETITAIESRTDLAAFERFRHRQSGSGCCTDVAAALMLLLLLLLPLLHQQHSQLAPRPLAFCLHTLTQDLVLRICGAL